MSPVTHRNAASLSVLVVMLIAAGCGGGLAAASEKLSAEETEAFLERSLAHEGDFECAAGSGAWDYECIYGQPRRKLGVDVNATQPTKMSGSIPADMSFEEAARASQQAIDRRWYAEVQELCASVARDRATWPKPDTLENKKSRIAGLWALSRRFRGDLSSTNPPAIEQERVDRLVGLLGEDVEDARKLYDALARKDLTAADTLFQRLKDRGREEAEILARFGCQA